MRKRANEISSRITLLERLSELRRTRADIAEQLNDLSPREPESNATRALRATLIRVAQLIEKWMILKEQDKESLSAMTMEFNAMASQLITVEIDPRLRPVSELLFQLSSRALVRFAEISDDVESVAELLPKPMPTDRLIRRRPTEI